MDTDQFVNDQNLERFRKLADAVTTASERKTLLALLAEEHAKFIELQKLRAPACSAAAPVFGCVGNDGRGGPPPHAG